MKRVNIAGRRIIQELSKQGYFAARLPVAIAAGMSVLGLVGMELVDHNVPVSLSSLSLQCIATSPDVSSLDKPVDDWRNWQS